jgi:hypothetical protein
MFGKLNFDNEIYLFIKNTRNICRISDIIYHSDSNTLKKTGDYIKVEGFDTISFVPKSKLDICDKFEDKKYRTLIKIGKFVSKFFKKESIELYYINGIDIETFVNLFKSYFDSDLSKFKVISGEEILQYYLEDNYFLHNGYRHGTLWNSCMRYKEKNKFMSIYALNPDKIKMLVNLDSSGKVKTRALLWEDVEDKNGNKFKVMDRIYSVYDHEIESFKKWAKQNGYIFKYEQSAKNEVFFNTGESIKDLYLKVKLDVWKLKKYPYIDTFKYLSYNDGVLSNHPMNKYDFVLIQNDGQLEREERVEIENDEVFDFDEVNTEDW